MEYKITRVELAPYDHDEFQLFILSLMKAAVDSRQILTLPDIVDAGYSTGRDGMAVMMEASILIREGFLHPLNGGGPLRGDTIICMVGEWPMTYTSKA